MTFDRRSRFALAAAVVLTATGCPPIGEDWKVEATITHRGAPLPGAWLIWLYPSRAVPTDAQGSLQLRLGNQGHHPLMVIHPTAGARTIDDGTYEVERSDRIRNNQREYRARVTMELDGYTGETLNCDAALCRAHVPGDIGETCNGTFTFAGVDGQRPIHRRVHRSRYDSGFHRLDVVAPAGGGAVAFFGGCSKGESGRRVFASGTYAPNAKLEAGSTQAVLQAALANDATAGALVTGALDARPEVRDEVVLHLAQRLERPGFSSVRPERRNPWHAEAPPTVKAAAEILRRRIAAAEPGARLPGSDARLAGALLGVPNRAGQDRRPRTSFECDLHACTVRPQCAGQLALFDPVSLGPDRSAYLGTLTSGHGAETAMPPSRIYEVGVFFGGTCDGAEHVDVMWARVAPADDRWARWTDDLAQPDRRAAAARGLVDVLRHRGAHRKGGWSTTEADWPMDPPTIAKRLAAAAVADGPGQSEVLTALDDLAERMLSDGRLSDDDRLVFGELTAPAVPAASEAAAAGAPPLRLLALQAAVHAPAAAALTDVFRRTVEAGDPAATVELARRLPETAAVGRAVAPLMVRALDACSTAFCRAPLYDLIGLHPDPVNASAAMDRFVEDRAAPAEALARQTPTVELVDAAMALALGPDGSARMEAATLLRTWRGAPDHVVPRALAALEQPETRRAALRVLGGQPSSKPAFEALYAAVASERSGDRREAMDSLAAIDTPAAVAALVEALEQHPDQQVRINAMSRLMRTTCAPAVVRAALVRAVEENRFERVRTVARSDLRRFDRVRGRAK